MAQGSSLNLRYKNALRLLSIGQLEKARSEFVALGLANPKKAEIPFQLSRIARMTGHFTDAARYIEQALGILPNEPALLSEAIAIYTTLDDQDKAITLYDRMIARAPKEIGPRSEKALFLQHAGRFDDANDIFKSLLKKHPAQPSLYRMFFTGFKVGEGNPLVGKLKQALANPKVPANVKHEGYFALAKAAEDQGQFDTAFAHLKTANALQRKLAPYDAARNQREATMFRNAQEAVPLPVAADDRPLQPLFVTGLPRSGTTLIEQILAAHSKASAGGELSHALKLIGSAFDAKGAAVPLKDMTPTALKSFATSYLQLATRDTGVTSGLITDKSIQNHLIFGYLAKAFPNAKFLVVHRDARAVAISIYKNFFATGTHRYSNDLVDIAKVIKAFRENVNYWKERMPDRIYEVYYDQLVADPETQARALIDAAGLEWEDACLEFHKAKNRVKTLSVAQVRQPINKGSSQAWKRYEKDLQPFIEEWGDDPWV